MFYYRVSEGEYDYYEETIICHEKEFPKEEFLKMVNSIPRDVAASQDKICEYLCERYDFKTFKITANAHQVWNAHTGYKWK